MRLLGIDRHDIIETPNLGVSESLYKARLYIIIQPGSLYVTGVFGFLDASVNIILIINRIIW